MPNENPDITVTLSNEEAIAVGNLLQAITVLGLQIPTAGPNDVAAKVMSSKPILKSAFGKLFKAMMSPQPIRLVQYTTAAHDDASPKWKSGIYTWSDQESAEDNARDGTPPHRLFKLNLELKSAEEIEYVKSFDEPVAKD